MPWYIYCAYFFGGAFFANQLPHLIAGVSGQALQTPFASPPFTGLSSPIVNIFWALANLFFSYILLVQIHPLDVQSAGSVVSCFLGFSAMALQCARAFTRIRKQSTT